MWLNPHLQSEHMHCAEQTQIRSVLNTKKRESEGAVRVKDVSSKCFHEGEATAHILLFVLDLNIIIQAGPTESRPCLNDYIQTQSA